MGLRGRNEYGLAQALLKPVNTAAIILLGIYTVLWGFWIGNPWWDVFGTAPIYREMSHIAPEWVWGTVAIVCGLMTAYGAWRPSYRTLTIGSGIAFAHWLTIAIFYFIGDWHNTGGITSLTFAIYAAFIYLNIRVNYKAGKLDITEIVP